MKKSDKKDNALILFKKRNLVLEMKKQGINRISSGSLLLIEKNFKKELGILMKILKEEMVVNGRKTLIENDVKKAFEEFKKEGESWEI